MKATFAAGLALLGLLAGFAASFAAPGAETVRFDVAADPSSLNPLFAHADAGVVEGQLAHLMFEPFIDVDERGNLVPESSAKSPRLRTGASRRTGGRSSTTCARACAGATAPR